MRLSRETYVLRRLFLPLIGVSGTAVIVMGGAGAG